MRRRGTCAVRREERARTLRRRAGVSRHVGYGRGCDRRCFARAGDRDGRAADLRRCAWGRLSARAGRSRPYRPHCNRYGCLRIARHGDDGRSDAARGGRGSHQGHRRRGGTHAARRQHACGDRRQGGAPRWRQSLHHPGRDRQGVGANIEAALPGLSADGWFFSQHMTYPYGVHIAVANVDRETGGGTIERYLLAYDIGRAVNPMLVEGQLAGGFAQGIGGTLLEEFRYDERGEPLSVNFADYLMPTAREVPALDGLITQHAPAPLNALGLKGAGEGGVNAVGAAIAAAIDDAVGISGAITSLPVTPQRLREIL